MDSLSGARVLVTGASGFIGSHLTRRLVDDGADVHALTSAVSSVYPTRLVGLRDDIVLHEGNLNDQGAMRALARVVRPEYVFHLGAYTHVGKSWERIDECTQTNVAGTVNLLRAIEDTGYRRLVFTGTSEIYGAVGVPFREDAAVEPGSPYAVSKYAAERFCRMLHRGRGWPIVLRGGMLSPRGYSPAYAFMIFSHRVLRYCTPALHVLALAANVALLAAGAGALYWLTFALQLALALAALLGGALRLRPLLLARYYVLTTVSPAAGLWDWLRHGTAAWWDAAEGTR